MRIVIAEDSVLLLEGLSQILTRFGHEVVAAVTDAPSLAAAVAEHAPDAVVTDVRMPPGFRDEGLRAALALRAERPGLPVLVLSQYVEQSYAADLLQTGGGVGYLLKDRVGQVAEFIDALDRIAAGGLVIDPEVVRRLLSRRRDRSPLERLTDREREVLALVGLGLTNEDIARRLVVSPLTAKTHVSRTMVKLGARDRAQLVVLAYESGLVRPGWLG